MLDVGYKDFFQLQIYGEKCLFQKNNFWDDSKSIYNLFSHHIPYLFHSFFEDTFLICMCVVYTYICICVCAHVWKVHVYTCVWKPVVTLGILFYHSPSHYFKKGLPSNLGLINLANLVKQGVSGPSCLHFSGAGTTDCKDTPTFLCKGQRSEPRSPHLAQKILWSLSHIPSPCSTF